MRLSDLDGRFGYDVVLLQTSSSRLQLYIEDKLKRKFKANRDTTFYIEGKADYKNVKQLVGVLPPMAERWYIRVDLDKVHDKDLYNLINSSNTCFFLCTCSKYTTFKEFKDKVKLGVADYYINYMRRPDLIYLYDAFVHEDNKLKNDLLSYVTQSYSSDIEALFDLFLALADGQKFESRQDISQVCGIGNLSVENYIFQLLKSLSVDVKRVIKNRTKYGVDLEEILGVSTFYNFMNKSINTLIELKMLIISGRVYKAVRNLPETYDEKSLARYQKYIWRLKEIPLSRLLTLRYCMGKKPWRSSIDVLGFIYKYYEMEGRRYVCNIKSELQRSPKV